MGNLTYILNNIDETNYMEYLSRYPTYEDSSYVLAMKFKTDGLYEFDYNNSELIYLPDWEDTYYYRHIYYAEDFNSPDNLKRKLFRDFNKILNSYNILVDDNSLSENIQDDLDILIDETHNIFTNYGAFYVNTIGTSNIASYYSNNGIRCEIMILPINSMTYKGYTCSEMVDFTSDYIDCYLDLYRDDKYILSSPFSISQLEDMLDIIYCLDDDESDIEELNVTIDMYDLITLSDSDLYKDLPNETDYTMDMDTEIDDNLEDVEVEDLDDTEIEDSENFELVLNSDDIDNYGDTDTSHSEDNIEVVNESLINEEESISNIDGVCSVKLNLPNNTSDIIYDSNPVSLSEPISFSTDFNLVDTIVEQTISESIPECITFIPTSNTDMNAPTANEVIPSTEEGQPLNKN